jgi:putative transposase
LGVALARPAVAGWFRHQHPQPIHGRIFQTLDDVRAAGRAFVARYNAKWLTEKNDHRSSADMRTVSQQALRRAA